MKPIFVRWLALGFLIQPLLSHAGSSIPVLEELFAAEIEGASRYAQPLSEAPATATIITADDIARYGHETIADALNMARGVHVTSDLAYSLLGVRGFNRPGDYNSRIQLQVDGARYNDVVYDQAMVGTEGPIDLAWVKRLEFVPGASSALYGGNALFGIANTILWSGADLNGTRITTKIGSRGQQGISLLSGNAMEDGSDWIAGLALEQSDGNNYRFPEFATGGHDGTARDLDGSHGIKAFARYSHAGWRVSASYSGRTKNIPTAYYGTSFGIRGNDVRDQQFHLDVAHASALSTELGQFARFHFGGYRFDANYIYPGLRSRDESFARWWSGEYRLAYSGIVNHQLQAGFEIRQNDRVEQRFFDVTPATSYLDDHRDSISYGGFFQDEWRLSHRWIANIGYRLDKIEQHRAIGSPRLALIFKPVPEASAKMLYGRSFRAANAYERFYSDGLTMKANPSLKPERVETAELSLDYAITPIVRLGIGRYFTRIEDIISQVTDPNDGMQVYTNQNLVTARGWETEVEAFLGEGWRIRGSMIWQRVTDMGSDAVNSPRKIGKLFIDGPITQDWTVGLGIQTTSSRLGLQGNVPGHAVGNLTLRQSRYGPYGQWSLTWRNVGNTNYVEPAGPEHTQSWLPQPGRQWLLRWEYRL